MSLLQYFDSRAKRLGIIDTKLAQAAAIFFALVIVKLVPEILSISVWWFVGLSIVCEIRPSITSFGRGPNTVQRPQRA